MLNEYPFTMKNLIVLLVLPVCSAAVLAQNGFSYQSIVRNADGVPQADMDVYLRFSILDGSIGGAILYRETQSLRSDRFGWISATVGTGVPVEGDFASISWQNSPKYLLVECADSPNGMYEEVASSLINNSIFIGPKGDKGDSRSQAQGTQIKMGIGRKNPKDLK